MGEFNRGGGGGGGFRSGGGRGGGGGGFRSGGDRSSDGGPKPVKEGETYDVTIQEVGSRGDGIARISNFVIFVAGVKKGDNVKIRITSVKARSAIGEVVGQNEGGAAPASGERELPAIEGEAASESEESEDEDTDTK